MAGKYMLKPFSEIDLDDPFFDGLKKDYPEFAISWFPKCVRENRTAWVFDDDQGLGAFIALKSENEPIDMVEKTLPACPRLKVSTLLLADRFRGHRLGEGALSLILRIWKKEKSEEIYLTIFPHHDDLITQVERFGFIVAGHNERGEIIYMRSRKVVDFSDPYKSFPFISPEFEKGGYLIVDDTYHDTLFPYSELKNVLQDQLERDVTNGATKIYVGQQWQTHYNPGEPVFIYRKHNGPGQPRYKSCITSYCVVTDVIAVKHDYKALCSFEEFQHLIGNKSVFTPGDLVKKYQKDRNITVIKMLYCGYFGKGNNVNMDWLDKNGLWSLPEEYPTNKQLTQEQCKKILLKGGKDVDNIFAK